VVLDGLFAVRCRSPFVLHFRKLRGVCILLLVDIAVFFGGMRRCLVGDIWYFLLGPLCGVHVWIALVPVLYFWVYFCIMSVV